MLKKFFAFGLLTVGTIASTTLGASANDAQLGVQTITSDNTAIHGVAVTQNNQDMSQFNVDGYDYFYAPDGSVQTGVQSIHSDNAAVGGVAVTQNDQSLHQGIINAPDYGYGYGYGHDYGYGYNPYEFSSQTGIQSIDSDNVAVDGVAVTDNDQELFQFEGF
jgi:hypothetical protein